VPLGSDTISTLIPSSRGHRDVAIQSTLILLIFWIRMHQMGSDTFYVPFVLWY
jgi:hypothetical protein